MEWSVIQKNIEGAILHQEERVSFWSKYAALLLTSLTHLIQHMLWHCLHRASQFFEPVGKIKFGKKVEFWVERKNMEAQDGIVSRSVVDEADHTVQVSRTRSTLFLIWKRQGGRIGSLMSFSHSIHFNSQYIIAAYWYLNDTTMSNVRISHFPLQRVSGQLYL